MKKIIFLAGFLLIFLPINASHLTGGSITYTCIDSAANKYLIWMTLYRDCNGTAALPNPATLRYYAGNVGAGITFHLPQISFTTVPYPSGPCIMASSGICYQRAIYSASITLPPQTNGYTLAWSDCCRNGAIANIVNSGSVSAIISARIPDPGQYPCNSSPMWNEEPAYLGCINMPYNFDASGSDPDGDSLSYRLISAKGIDAGTTNPGIPPFPLVFYSGSFSGMNPLPANPQLSINPLTGQLSGTPNSLGQYVVAIAMEEFRNGQLIGEYMREFQINVVNCSSILNLTVSNDVNICLNDSTQLSASATGAVSLTWLPANTLSDPNIPNPYAKPSFTTTYTLTVTDSAQCTLSSSVTVNVISPGSIDAGNDTTICKGASVQLQASSGANVWDINSTLSCTNCENPIATPTVTTTYYVNAYAPGCSDRDSITITVLPVPTVVITPAGPFCGDATVVQLTAFPPGGQWSGPGITSFGFFDPAISGPGVHTIHYSYTDSNGCSASKSEPVKVYPKITAVANIQKTLDAVSSTGAIYLNVGGGQPPYFYNWSNGATSKDITNLSTGNYLVTIMDNSGCTRSFNFFVDTLYAVGIEDYGFSNELARLVLFPNPAQDKIYISFTGSSIEMSLEVVDRLGKMVLNMDQVNNKKDIVLDLTNFNSGVYFLILRSDRGSIVRKFIILK